jgi:hypothetical protein
MPGFGEIGDPTAVENLYVGKVVVYVEGEADANLYYEIAGSAIRGHLEFRGPPVGEGGSDAVITRVRAERPANAKVFGLVDGEAAAKVGAVDKLLECTDLFFRLHDPDFVGILFLGQHELENLLATSGDLPDVILRDLDPLLMGRVTLEEVEGSIKEATRIFFFAALLKYASVTLNHRSRAAGGQGCRTLKSSHFLGRQGFRVALAEIRAQVAAEGEVTWGQLRREIRRTHQGFVARLRTAGADVNEISAKLRVADGKSLLKLLKRTYSPNGRWESHLATAIGGTDFSETFRDNLLAMTT